MCIRDSSIILSNLGVPFFGLLALVLATWTTNVTNAYSCLLYTSRCV